MSQKEVQIQKGERLEEKFLWCWNGFKGIKMKLWLPIFVSRYGCLYVYIHIYENIITFINTNPNMCFTSCPTVDVPNAIVIKTLTAFPSFLLPPE